MFYTRGESTSNSQKWQCKTCKKLTNVLPTRERSFNYHQQRNDVLIKLATLILNREPVRRACEVLGISSNTYYLKLEWLYKRCLEFLERHETKALKSKAFGTIWLDTDQMIYNLNNVRKRGKGGTHIAENEEPVFATHVVVSGDLYSRFIFRADVAFDWEVSLAEIESDTITFKDDHLNNFAKKNARLRLSSYPQPPTEHDTQSELEYLSAKQSIERRGQYLDGIHVKSGNTAIAHYWLIKQMVKAKAWRIISDADYSLMDAVKKVFSPEIKRGAAHYFICQSSKNRSLRESYIEYKQSRSELKTWALDNGYEDLPYWESAKLKLIEDLKTHNFYDYVVKKGHSYPVKPKKPNPIRHPLPSPDEGSRLIDCATDLSTYSPEELAKILMKVSNKATNAFMQQTRRRISILERPLMTARGEGKSYIYANCNPKYAQYAMTLLRTFYNFCLPVKTKNGVVETPAQRLGIADKAYTLRDIIYFK